MPVPVFIAASVEPALVDLLSADPRFRLSDQLEDAEVLITRTTNVVDAAMLGRAPRLRLVAQGTSGVDNIDLAAARARNVAVVHLPGVNANAVAELVIGWIIALTRAVPRYTRDVSSGRWNRDDCAARHEMRHYRVGIVGLGNVGTRVARLARPFGMPVCAYDPYVPEFDGVEQAASLTGLLSSSDVVTLHVPLTDETRGMVGGSEIARMPSGAILLNAARGEVLDTGAALAALASGHLGGLALDVYDPEPPSRSWPDNPRLIVTPHIAGCTFEAKRDAAAKLYAAIVEFVA